MGYRVPHSLLVLLFALFFAANNAFAQGFGDEAGMSQIDEGLLKFGLYGRDSVFIGYDAKTADSGAIGGANIAIEMGSVLRGDVFASNDLFAAPGRNSYTLSGDVVVGGDLRLGNELKVLKNLYVQGDMNVQGYGSGPVVISGQTRVGGKVSIGNSNQFRGGMQLAQGSIHTNSDHFSNYFGTPAVALKAFVLSSGVHNAPQLAWNTPFSMPAHLTPMNYAVPSTKVFPTNNNCIVTQNSWWKSGDCVPNGEVAVAPNGAQVLPPGSYGELHLNHESKIVLGEGIYHFSSITMNGTNHQIKVYQPTGARTQILVEGKVEFLYRSSLMPLDTAGNKGGTILLYTNDENELKIGQENEIWATLVAPKAIINLVYGTKLFGQALAQKIYAAQNFEGNDGRYIPFYPTKPRIGLVFSQGALVTEGSGGGTKVFPLKFSMDHENGLPVTVFFHTEFRRPAKPGNADAEDINLIVKDSVVSPVAITEINYKKLIINSDNDFELDDYFDLVLDSVINGELDSIATNNVYALGIKNDDPPPQMSFVGDKVLTVNEDAGTIKLTVKLNAKSILASTAQIVVQSSVGVLKYDIPKTISVGAGETSISFSLVIHDDFIDAPDETLKLILRTANSATLTIGADSVKTIVVKDNAPPVKLAANMQTEFTVNEPSSGKTTLKIPIVLAGVSGWDIPWALKVLPGSGDNHAVLDEDYRIVKINGKINAGQLTDTAIVEVLSDIWDEGDEQFTLTFDTQAGKTNYLDFSGKNSFVITIPRNGGPSLDDVTVDLNEDAPLGADVLYLSEILNRRDTVIAYNWSIVNTLNGASFALKEKSGKGLVLELADNTGMEYRPGMPDFKVQLEVCSKFNCATGVVTVQIVNTRKAPQIVPMDTINIIENSTGGTKVDSLNVKSGSGWDLVWDIIGGEGAENYDINPETGVIEVKPGADLDYENEKSRHQLLKIQVTNAHGMSDTLWVVVELEDEIEYSFAKIDFAQIPEGQKFNNPDTIWLNVDSLDIEWVFDQGDSAETVGFDKDGVINIVRTYCAPTKNFCGSDTLVVRRNTKEPQLVWEKDDIIVDLPRHTVQVPRDSNDTRIYTNDPQKVLEGLLSYVDSTGKLVDIPIDLSTKLKEGKDVEVIYTFTDPYGNAINDTLVIHLDTIPPEVKIFNPEHHKEFWIYNVDVGWTVDGVIMDTLNRASLDKGINIIRRSYMDLAGNIGSDSVEVILNNNKSDAEIDIVNPMVTLDPESIDKLNQEFPPRPDENFSFKVVNQQTLEEEELQWGKPGQVEVPKKDERRVYNGLVNSNIGPTLRVEIRFQHVGGTNGEGLPRGGTLADLFEKMRADGVDESKALCGESMPADPYNTPLWRNDIHLVVDYFDNLGQFVDRFVVEQDSISHEYLNDGGVGIFYFTIEPDKIDKRLRTTTGRALANGPYVIKSMVTAKSTDLWCAGNHKKGEVIKTNNSEIKLFGYRRSLP
ncbi:MAG: cadherin repeat domain-containing protein [Fibrobacter sp.]|nr:cadherin repeat domain-containing protein [Fibrobacter sp.]